MLPLPSLQNLYCHVLASYRKTLKGSSLDLDRLSVLEVSLSLVDATLPALLPVMRALCPPTALSAFACKISALTDLAFMPLYGI